LHETLVVIHPHIVRRIAGGAPTRIFSPGYPETFHSTGHYEPKSYAPAAQLCPYANEPQLPASDALPAAGRLTAIALPMIRFGRPR